jgi:hypothetical protein
MFKLLAKVFASWRGRPDTAPQAADAATPPAGAGAPEPAQAAPAPPAPAADSREGERAPARPDVSPPAGLPADAGGDREEEQIRVRAYFLAEAAGFPAGRMDEFWHQAEREVRGAAGRDRNGAAPARRPAPGGLQVPGGC